MMTVIDAPCTFIRIEVRRTVDGRDVIESAEVIRTESLENFFGENGLEGWLRRLNEGRFDRRQF
ncbi:MAG: hypothetical protein HRF40_10575 [Nitrososphaera sp.]|jgi:hypothetical protein